MKDINEKIKAINDFCSNGFVFTAHYGVNNKKKIPAEIQMIADNDKIIAALKINYYDYDDHAVHIIIITNLDVNPKSIKLYRGDGEYIELFNRLKKSEKVNYQKWNRYKSVHKDKFENIDDRIQQSLKSFME